MELNLQDVRGIANRRAKSHLSSTGYWLWLAGAIMLLGLFVWAVYPIGRGPTTYPLPNGAQLVVAENGAVIRGWGGDTSTAVPILGDLAVTPLEREDRTLPVVIGSFLGVWFVIYLGVIIYDEGKSRQWKRDFIQKWVETKEIPKEE